MKSLVLRSAVAFLFVASVGAAREPAPGVEHKEAFRNLPAAPDVLYLPDKYAACLRCHPKEVIEEEDFNVPTNFRDTILGKNLHGIHVYRQPKGTNCTACHRIDGETGTISFRPEAGVSITESGGHCTSACHRPKTYRNAGRSP